MNALGIAVFALFHAVQAPPPAPAGWSRLRVTDSRTADLLRLGLQQSATLRELVAEIEAGKVMVYASSERGLPGRLTGHMKLLGKGGDLRYVKIAVRRSLPAPHFIAALAHEFQHVTELIDHPDVRDPETLTTLYRRIGDERPVRGRVAWETDAARQVTRDVRRELLTTHRPRAASR
ncbi:MAG: hypothetical protein AB7P34_13290 [Vicinamibacterales bacterium]